MSRVFIALTFAVALVALGCAAGRGGSSPDLGAAGSGVVVPTPTPVPESTEPPLDCPADPPTIMAFVNADRDCFGGRDLTFTGWLDLPPSMGFPGAPIEPAWLAYPPTEQSALWSTRPVAGPGGLTCPIDGQCGWFFVHIDPARPIELPRAPHWIRVTGHTSDPASRDCKYTDPDGQFSPLPRPEDAQAQCRREFVLVHLELATQPS